MGSHTVTVSDRRASQLWYARPRSSRRDQHFVATPTRVPMPTSLQSVVMTTASPLRESLRRRGTRAAQLAGLALMLGCTAKDRSDDAEVRAATAGVIISTAADADALVPPLVASTAGKQVVDLLFDHLAAPTGSQVNSVGDAGFQGELAKQWNWSADSLSIAFELNADARWHDGKPVLAEDVRFSFQLFTDPAVASMHARNFDGIDSVTVRDAHTAVAWWNHRHPEQFFQLVYNLAIMPRHLLDSVPRSQLLASAFASHPVGSGRFRFGSWERKRQLVLTADSGNYRGRPRFDRVIWTVAPDPNAATMAVLAGQADVLEVLRGDAVTKAAQVPTLRTVEYGSLDYGYLVFNEQPSRGRPSLFGERAIRVALSAAVDRASVVQNVLDSLGRVAIGPMTRSNAMTDTTLRQIAFDTVAAARTLDSLGWKWNAKQGVRVRAGRPLTFGVLAPASSGTRKKLAVLLQAQFARVGAKVEVESVESGVFTSRLLSGDFDAALGVWRNDPSASTIRQAWGSPHGEEIGANFGRYASRAFDSAIDSANLSFDVVARKALFRRAYQIIIDDAPAVWLYEPRNLAAVRSRLIPTDMRPDAWLAGLANWQVQGAEARVASGTKGR